MNITEIYGNRTRVRVIGILQKEGKYLLVNHTGLNEENTFWHFPGGGIEVHENIKDALKREFLEETGLIIDVEDFIKLNEHLAPPLHAVELFFNVKHISGSLSIGQDPELPIIEDCRFLSKQELEAMPKNQLSSSIFELI